MSGHNKWSSIKHRKGKADAQRGRAFTKITRELITAAKIGGGDPEGNSRLRQAINAARAVNMPTDNISRGIDYRPEGGDGGGEAARPRDRTRGGGCGERPGGARIRGPVRAGRFRRGQERPGREGSPYRHRGSGDAPSIHGPPRGEGGGTDAPVDERARGGRRSPARLGELRYLRRGDGGIRRGV